MKAQEDVGLCQTAARTLGGLRPLPPGAVQALAAAVANEKGHSNVRADAARALGDIGPEAKAAVPVLQEVLASDKRRGIEVHIHEALKKIQGK